MQDYIEVNSEEIAEDKEIILTDEEQLIRDCLENTDKQGSEATVLFGILGGIAIAAFVNPFVGGFFGLALAGNSIVSGIGRAKQRTKLLKGEIPALQLLNASQLKDYKNEVGEEEFQQQLKQVDTKDNWGVVDNQLKEQAFEHQLLDKQAGVNPVDELADYHTQHCLILGGSGDGKDLWLSNVIRKLVEEQPNLRIYLLDAKGLPREKAYYDGIPNLIVERKQCGEADDAVVTLWFREQFLHFMELSKQDDYQWLFVSTEQTLIGEAFARSKDTFLEEVASKQTTTGSGFDRAYWFLAQYPNLANLGMSSNSRGQLKTFAVVKAPNVTNAARGWARSGLVGKPKEKELRALCKSSEVERCFFSPNTGEWHPMPRLENYSGYDRDNRRRIERTGDRNPEPKDSHSNNSPSPKQAEFLSQLEEYVPPEGKDLDIVEAIKFISPDVKNENLPKIIEGIKATAKASDKQALLSKYSLD